MTILINSAPAKFWDNIDCLFGYGFHKEIVVDKNTDIVVYNLKNYWRFLLKRETEKIIKEIRAENRPRIVFANNTLDEIKEYFSKIQKVTKKECFFDNLPKILNKFYNQNSGSELYILASEYDKTIFDVADAAAPKVKVISLITENDKFFEEFSEYTMSKHGIGVNLKNFHEIKNKALAVVLNHHEYKLDFSGVFKFVIDPKQKYEISGAKYLDDFSSVNIEKLRKYQTDYCYFVEKDKKISNLIWKISKIS